MTLSTMPKTGSQLSLGSSGELAAFWSFEQDLVQNTLARLLTAPSGASPRLFAAMRHAVLAPAKRLRPILAIAAYRSMGGSDRRIYPVAAAIEMLHTYSLIHDDLPCMDDDDQRRGQPTVHVAFDEATAVLAGDALQALAFEILAREGNTDVIQTLAKAVGPEGMADGQMADLEAEGMTPTEELVTSIHQRKTGRLITASLLSGAAMLGVKSGPTHFLPLLAYGDALGLAFQITDDILELTETAEKLGKPTGSDIKHEKVTFPAAVGLDESRQRARALVEKSKQALSEYGGDPAILLAIADFIVSRDR